jgi:EpsI family protein
MKIRLWFWNPYAAVLAAFLLAQIGFTYGLSRRPEQQPPRLGLEKLPPAIGQWRLYQEGEISKEIRDALKATDLLSRVYANTDGKRTASLFIAYFQSQRTGVWVHSPKHCLPGTGWTPVESTVVPLRFAGRSDAAPVNRHIVAKGDAQSVVLYWYEGRGRVYSSEYAAKLYLVSDAIRLNRTDVSLIRIITPVVQQDLETAWATARQFAEDVFPSLRPFIPGPSPQ